VATVIALVLASNSMRKGDRAKFNIWLRWRVAAQGRELASRYCAYVRLAASHRGRGTRRLRLVRGGTAEGQAGPRAGGRSLPAHAFRHGASRVFAQAASASQGTPSEADSMMSASMPRSLSVRRGLAAHVPVFKTLPALKMVSDFAPGVDIPAGLSSLHLHKASA
jgi:hypothetical protein